MHSRLRPSNRFQSSDCFFFFEVNSHDPTQKQSPICFLSTEIVCFHGTYEEDSTYLLETVKQGKIRSTSIVEIRGRLPEHKWELILCGHTHVPRVVEVTAPTGKSPFQPGI